MTEKNPAKQSSERKVTSFDPSELRAKVMKYFKAWLRYFQRSFVQRLPHLKMARRTVVSWLVIVLCLVIGVAAQSNYYTQEVSSAVPATGGKLALGTLDKITTISPLNASTDTEKMLSLLVYRSLVRYDESGRLVGDLATTWSASGDGTTWSFNLRDGAKWSDGRSITPSDVKFTLEKIAETDTNMSEALNGATIKTNGQTTVEITLPSVSASLDTFLTVGILPEHIYHGQSAAEINKSVNTPATKNVMSGLFSLSRASSSDGIWRFEANTASGTEAMKTRELTVRQFDTADEMMQAFKGGAVNYLTSVRADQVKQYSAYDIQSNVTNDGVFLLFNTDGEVTGDANVRQAVRLLIDRAALREAVAKSADGKSLTALETPIARGIYSQVDGLKQPGYDASAAAKLLNDSGYSKVNGKWQKGGDELKLQLTALADSDVTEALNYIAKALSGAGIQVEVKQVSSDAERQSVISTRSYDLLVQRLRLGGDADVSAYWTSGQASGGLNFANYSNRRADIALMAGRSNIDASVREARYVAFVNEWLNDCPAIALYQARRYQVSRGDTAVLDKKSTIVDASSLIDNAANWSVGTEEAMRTP